MMQIACNEMNEEHNPVVWDKFIKSSMQAYNLYFDTLDIERKHNLVNLIKRQCDCKTRDLRKIAKR